MKEAREMLNRIHPDTVAMIRSMQASRLLLARQTEVVQHMAGEGLLTAADAEEFLDEIVQDTQRIESDRNEAYTTQAQQRVKQQRLSRRRISSVASTSTGNGYDRILISGDDRYDDLLYGNIEVLSSAESAEAGTTTSTTPLLSL